MVLRPNQLDGLPGSRTQRIRDPRHGVGGRHPVSWPCQQLLLLVLLSWMVHAGPNVTTCAADDALRHRRLVIATEFDYPPYSYRDGQGCAAGFNVELTRALANVMGVDLEIQTKTFGEIRETLEAGGLDAIAGMYRSEQREKQVSFSSPFAIVQHAVFTRRDSPSFTHLEQLRGKEIIVMRRDIMHDFVLEQGLCQHPTTTATLADALRCLASGKGDCAVLAMLPGVWRAQELQLTNISYNGLILRPSEYCFAVRQNDPELLSRITEGLAILKQTGRHRQIVDRWLGQGELPSETPASRRAVRIGVLAQRGREKCAEQWGLTADYLNSRIPGCVFKIVPLDFAEIYPTAQQGQVEFMLTNPSFYVGLERNYGANRLLTLVNGRLHESGTLFGGVVFCRADRHDIQGLRGLVGRSIAAVESTSLGGWQVAWREFKQQGIDPQHDFSDLRFVGTHDRVVEAVLAGSVDAGTVRTGTLECLAEEGSLNLDDIRVIDQRFDDGFASLHSTRLYPEWPLTKLPGTSDELAEQVAAALMNMPSDCPAANAAGYSKWTIPLNYQPVHDCLRELCIGPYEDLEGLTLGAALRQYWPWLAAGLLVALGLFIFAVYVLQLNRRLDHAVAVEQKRAGQQAEVARFGQLALSDVALDVLLVEAVSIASRPLGARYAGLLEYRPQTDDFSLRAGVGWDDGWVGWISIPHAAHSQCGYTLSQTKAVVCQDIHQEDRFEPHALLTEHHVIGGMTVVIPGIEGPFGVLGVYHDRPHQYSEDDAHFVEAIANLLAAATDRHRTMEDIRQAEEKLRTICVSALDAIVMMDAHGKVVHWNPSAENMFGYSAEDAIGRCVHDLLTPAKYRQ